MHSHAWKHRPSIGNERAITSAARNTAMTTGSNHPVALRLELAEVSDTDQNWKYRNGDGFAP